MRLIFLSFLVMIGATANAQEINRMLDSTKNAPKTE
jgi:hypothetical protein